MKRKLITRKTLKEFPGITARNSNILKYESYIHEYYYPYIIHPYSAFRIGWEKVMSFLIGFRLCLCSFLWAIFDPFSFYYQIPVVLFQTVNAVDVILNFLSGYVEPETEVVILDPRKIAVMYLKTYFIVDFLPCIPVQIIIFSLYREDNLNIITETHLSTPFLIMYIFNFCVLLRLFCSYRYIINCGKRSLWNEFRLYLFLIVFLFCILLVYTNDFYRIYYYIYVHSYSEDTVYLYCDFQNIHSYLDRISCYYLSFGTMILDLMYYDARDITGNFLLRSVSLMVSFFMSMFFSAFFIVGVLLKLKTTEKFFEYESRILTLARKRNLSTTLKHKGILYFQIYLINKNYRDAEIFRCIPDVFKADIFFQICLPLLKNFYVFDELPMYVVRRLAESMKYQLHLPNDIVMELGDLSMYFVLRGVVALYSEKQIELYHFEAGSSFNGVNMIMGEVIMGTYAISIEVAEIYRLSYEKFYEIMKPYPKVLKDLREKVQNETNVPD